MSSNDRMLKFIGVITLIILVLGIIEYTNYNKSKNEATNEVTNEVVNEVIDNLLPEATGTADETKTTDIPGTASGVSSGRGN